MCDVTQASNPFKAPPVPIPAKGWYLLASDLFEACALSDHLQLNLKWIKSRPRTTKQIHNALFPDYDMNGMGRDEIQLSLNAALFNEGLTPSDESLNPTWT